MHEIIKLKEMLCKELEEYGSKGELSAGTLDIVDKLAHTIKNLDKIIEVYEEDEGSYYDGGSYEVGDRSSARGRMSRGMYGGSYARGRNARRDSRGRYSNEGYSRNSDISDRLRDLMEDAPDEKTRQEIHKLAMKMEQM